MKKLASVPVNEKAFKRVCYLAQGRPDVHAWIRISRKQGMVHREAQRLINFLAESFSERTFLSPDWLRIDFELALISSHGHLRMKECLDFLKRRGLEPPSREESILILDPAIGVLRRFKRGLFIFPHEPELMRSFDEPQTPRILAFSAVDKEVQLTYANWIDPFNSNKKRYVVGIRR